MGTPKFKFEIINGRLVVVVTQKGKGGMVTEAVVDLCSALYIEALTRTKDHAEWGTLIRFYDLDGIEHRVVVRFVDLRRGTAALKELLNRGLHVDEQRKYSLIVRYIRQTITEKRAYSSGRGVRKRRTPRSHGFSESPDDKAILAQVVARVRALNLHLGMPVEDMVNGFINVTKDGRKEICIEKSCFRKTICKGYKISEVQEALRKSGFLMEATDGFLRGTHFPYIGKTDRMCVIDATLLDKH